MTVLEFRKSKPRIGLLARNGVSGPEKDLVESFTKHIPQCFRWRSGHVAIFHEPQMETGFPDIVAVQFLPESFKGWRSSRLELTSSDVKLLHHLHGTRGSDSGNLMTVLGIDGRSLLASFERLLDARMITRTKGRWVPRPMTELFGIKSIIAVEAKIKNWGDAFNQAQLNHWFASASFVLSPVEKPAESVLKRSERTGVGIMLMNGSGPRKIRNSQKNHIPASYGSWMFNEWIGRHIHLKERGEAAK